jgi:hypothetical protein
VAKRRVPRSDPSKQFRRLTPSELRSIGSSPKARRYVELGKRLTRQTTTLSHRTYQTKLDSFRAKRALTREAATKERIAGRLAYVTPQAAETAKYTKFSRFARENVTGIVNKDIKLIYKKNQEGWNELDDDEQEEFGRLFKRYSRDQVLDILGSPPTMTKAA